MIKFLSVQHEFWTIVFKRFGRRHQRLKFVLKWFDFFVTPKTYSYQSMQIISQTLHGATSLC